MAVVSLLGDHFHAISIGLTAFQNKAYDVAVPGWDMNTQVTGDYSWHANKRVAKGGFRPLRRPKPLESTHFEP